LVTGLTYPTNSVCPIILQEYRVVATKQNNLVQTMHRGDCPELNYCNIV